MLTDDDIYGLVNPIMDETLRMIRWKLWNEERLSSSGLIGQLPEFTWEMDIFKYMKEPVRPSPKIKVRIQEAGDKDSVVFVLQLIGRKGQIVGGIWPGEWASRGDKEGIVKHARFYQENDILDDIVSQVARAIDMLMMGPKAWRPRRPARRSQKS